MIHRIEIPMRVKFFPLEIPFILVTVGWLFTNNSLLNLSNVVIRISTIFQNKIYELAGK